METPLRAIEMSDSSSLGINPFLAAEVYDVCTCVSLHACISSSPFVRAFVHVTKKFFFFSLISVRGALWSTACN